MSFLDLAKRRYSVRSYDKRPVEREKLEQILNAAHVAPTAANLQPTRLLVVDDAQGLRKLGLAANTYGAPLAIVVCADKDVAWVRPADGMSTADIDAAIVTDHMMMEATDLGLGTVWICWFDPAVVAEQFDLPGNLEPVNILAVGYGRGTAKSPDRHEVERIAMSELVMHPL